MFTNVQEYVYLIASSSGGLQRIPTQQHATLKSWTADGTALLLGDAEEPIGQKRWAIAEGEAHTPRPSVRDSPYTPALFLTF